MGLLLGSGVNIHRVARLNYHICKRYFANSSGIPNDPKVAWFYATDIPKSKPEYFDWKPTKVATQYDVFSDEDSQRLEVAYQRIKAEQKRLDDSRLSSNILDLDPDDDDIDIQSFVKLSTPIPRPNVHHPVPVKEDGLFQVDLDKRELRPCYWDGPVYDVRRGTWFYSGSKLTPCPEGLAGELEELYKKELLRLDDIKKSEKINKPTPSNSKAKDEQKLKNEKDKTHILDSTLDDDIDIIKFSDDPEIVHGYKSLSTSVLQKIIGSSLGGSKKIIRGYKARKEDLESRKVQPSLTEDPISKTLSPLAAAMANSTSSDTIAKIEDIFLPFSQTDSETKMEEQIKYDYNEKNESENYHTSNIPVDHLVLCIHGIGQKLSQKVESINFVHDINVFRKLTKSIQYEEASTASSPITGDEEDVNSNEKKPTTKESSSTSSTSSPKSRIQLLPVLWRHDMTFGRKIHPDQKDFVTVENINVEGVPTVRTLFSDVVADFLLYSEPAHKKQMLEIVTYQLNRIYREFCKRNPVFAKNPKVSIIAHSLGCVIGYEALRAAAKVAKEKKQLSPKPSATDVRTSSSEKHSSLPPSPPSSTYLEFPVSNFITIGSPLGLFLLIGGRVLRPEELNIGAMYNLFHPSDPISYRIEPLMSPQASNLKPVPIPYTKGGLTTQIQELSELGSKISQSATIMWNNITSSLTRSDILEQIKESDKAVAIAAEAQAEAEAKNHSKSESKSEAESESQSPTKSSLNSKQIEEIKEKLKQINPNGRLDYVLQEGVLDISILQAIASHVSYFENVDIANFVLQIIYKQTK